MKNLIPLTKENGFDIELDIRYATTNNVTGLKFYDQPYALLHPEAAQALKTAISLAKIHGYRFKIFDSFRPFSAQEFLFSKFPNSVFVSDPKTGKVTHCRGIAVDITLIDESGQELDMGTEFDSFTKEAQHGSTTIPKTAQKNRYLLAGIMATAGWNLYQPEWWHYQLPDYQNYPVVVED